MCNLIQSNIIEKIPHLIKINGRNYSVHDIDIAKTGSRKGELNDQFIIRCKLVTQFRRIL